MSRKLGCRVIHDARGIGRSLTRRSEGGDEEVGAANSTKCVTGVYVPRIRCEAMDADAERDQHRLETFSIRIYVWEA